MKKTVLKLPPKPKTVVQQHTDFTAEGSPPPGKVGTEAPVQVNKQARTRHDKPKESKQAVR
jgi:hypothetical protein